MCLCHLVEVLNALTTRAECYNVSLFSLCSSLGSFWSCTTVQHLTLRLATSDSTHWSLSPPTHTHAHNQGQICTVFAMGELLIYINYEWSTSILVEPGAAYFMEGGDFMRQRVQLTCLLKHWPVPYTTCAPWESRQTKILNVCVCVFVSICVHPLTCTHITSCIQRKCVSQPEVSATEGGGRSLRCSEAALKASMLLQVGGIEWKQSEIVAQCSSMWNENSQRKLPRPF